MCVCFIHGSVPVFVCEYVPLYAYVPFRECVCGLMSSISGFLAQSGEQNQNRHLLPDTTDTALPGTSCIGKMSKVLHPVVLILVCYSLSLSYALNNDVPYLRPL